MRFSYDFWLEVARGRVYNHSAIHKFGASDVVATSETTIWPEGGRYVFPTSAVTMTVSSSDANDTSAGTGGRTVQIYGLDSNYDLIDETISMNGQTAVYTTNQYLRIYRLRVITAGSSQINEGTIYIGTGALTAGKPAVVYGCIVIAEGQSLLGYYTVPNKYTGYLISYKVGTGKNDSVLFKIYLRHNAVTDASFQLIDHEHVTQDNVTTNMFAPKRLDSKTDIEFTGASTAGTTEAECHFEIILVKDKDGEHA